MIVVFAVQVEHRCPDCGNEEMTYTTQQTRSADEGQTVFFSCPKCKYEMRFSLTSWRAGKKVLNLSLFYRYQEVENS